MLTHSSPEAAKQLLTEAQEDVASRWKLYEHWAAMPVAKPEPKPAEETGKAKGAGSD
jgi:hypothetical protein